MRRLFLIVAATIAVSTASAQRRIGQEMTLNRTAHSGQPVRIYTHVDFNTRCEARASPLVTTRVQPAHGTISVRPDTVEVRELGANSVDCTGRMMPGTGVYYTSQPGFVGTDQFQYDVEQATMTREVMVTVEIR